MTEEITKYPIEYKFGRWLLAHDDKIQELANFYSNHYGIWSEDQGDSSKRRITLSSKRIIGWLDNDYSEVWTVRDKDELIGYAIALKGKSKSRKSVIWVTQFVVHNDYRNLGVGKRLLFSIWGLSSYFAWGLVTANPYAVRALEKATRRRCEPKRIKKSMVQLFNFGAENVCYIKPETEMDVTALKSAINTRFFVDHSELDDMMRNITTTNKPWKMGNIQEGWEWFAFTFSDQPQIELSPSEIEDMLSASDAIAKEAYSRMQMDNKLHKWSKSTAQEVDYIIRECKLTHRKKILDVGCGKGRHTIELCERGYNITGIDYSAALITSAREKVKDFKLKPKFIVGDITDIKIQYDDKPFDGILCIYDVIGSYADNNKNINILNNITRLLKPGGYVIISVMNLHLTESRAKHKFKLKESSAKLLSLEASEIMEKTGNIFDPNFYLLDEDTKVIYRRETFSYQDNNFPTELIVRDRRYYVEDIIKMCEDADLICMQSRFVNAGWAIDYDKFDKNAKEILLICKKRNHTFSQMISKMRKLIGKE